MTIFAFFFYTIVLTSTGDLDIRHFGFQTVDACETARQAEHVKALAGQKTIVITTCAEPLQPLTDAQMEQAFKEMQPKGTGR